MKIKHDIGLYPLKVRLFLDFYCSQGEMMKQNPVVDPESHRCSKLNAILLQLFMTWAFKPQFITDPAWCTCCVSLSCIILVFVFKWWWWCCQSSQDPLINVVYRRCQLNHLSWRSPRNCKAVPHSALSRENEPQVKGCKKEKWTCESAWKVIVPVLHTILPITFLVWESYHDVHCDYQQNANGWPEVIFISMNNNNRQSIATKRGTNSRSSSHLVNTTNIALLCLSLRCAKAKAGQRGMENSTSHWISASTFHVKALGFDYLTLALFFHPFPLNFSFHPT